MQEFSLFLIKYTFFCNENLGTLSSVSKFGPTILSWRYLKALTFLAWDLSPYIVYMKNVLFWHKFIELQNLDVKNHVDFTNDTLLYLSSLSLRKGQGQCSYCNARFLQFWHKIPKVAIFLHCAYILGEDTGLQKLRKLHTCESGTVKRC